jgi:hypothetical protein
MWKSPEIRKRLVHEKIFRAERLYQEFQREPTGLGSEKQQGTRERGE